ncbi:MAG: DUF5106 domain-containing protein, partial [Bacteroidetes bacterium]|nr:DUF5106 domain-containing protein [Bacteroidota bacterium]
KWKRFIESEGLGDFINVADPHFKTNMREIYDIESTPRYFILDEQHKIIGKKIGPDQMDDFLEHLFKEKERKKKKGDS